MEFPGHFEYIFQQLNFQRVNGQLCDCMVLVGGKSFQAHSSILAACSSHFKALLSSTEEDPGGGARVRVMELDPGVVTPEAFSVLLDLIYTSTLTLGASNAMDVLLAASHLHLNTVVKACKLHLSKHNFPTSPPKGWRSTVPQGAGYSADQLDVGEVTQSGGGVGGGVADREQSATFPVNHKRKPSLAEERPCSRHKSSRLSRPNCGEDSPRVTRSSAHTETEGEELPSPDSMKTDVGFFLENGGPEEEEVEEKYETTKGGDLAPDEVQFPSQSHSGLGDLPFEQGEHLSNILLLDGEMTFKVKVGEEEEEEQRMEAVEVKREPLPETAAGLGDPWPPAVDCSGRQLDLVSGEPFADIPTAASDCTSSNLRPGTEPQRESTDGEEDSVDHEGLDGLSDLGLSCFLSPSSQARLAAAGGNSLVECSSTPTEAQKCSGSFVNSGSAADSATTSAVSSYVFPVNSVPLQQLFATEGQSSGDTLVLQPAQSTLQGFLRGFTQGLSVHASLQPPSKAGTTRARGGIRKPPGLRRIAPKTSLETEVLPHRTPTSVAPANCTQAADTSSPGGAVHRPVLTQAAEEVLSKCKKAVSENNVLLVEGEKKYACKICCKTFMNLTDCKKHIRVHTGEKPYPCQRCGKRFSQSSHLYKHSSTSCRSWKSTDPRAVPSTL
ncbi:zinc finger and BTB domain-containing protein 5-like [Aplochiton taeniatus]